MLWQYLVRPILFRFDPEWTHYFSMGTFGFANRLWPVDYLSRKCFGVHDAALKAECLGLSFDNPIGLAAGFDKDARWYRPLSSLGFGHVEVGTITAHPQSGNPKPRLFRLVKDRAIVNRMGFNNRGSEFAADCFGRSEKPDCVLGINIGKSKITPIEGAVEDYLQSLGRLFEFADYLTINVSSPNTPGLRQLQDREPLLNLLSQLTARSKEIARERGCEARPILLKIAPDLNEHQLDDIVQILVESKADGVIATNTTISREGLKTPQERVQATGAGGLSGQPLTLQSRNVVKHLYRQLQGRIPVIGVGGIMKGDDAWQMICSGASLVQVYTGFIYGGPGFVAGLNRFLSMKLKENGYANISEAVGTAIKR